VQLVRRAEPSMIIVRRMAISASSEILHRLISRADVVNFLTLQALPRKVLCQNHDPAITRAN
jgi:hypothetical protein